MIRSIYNVNNGTTYDNGNLPLITSAEINDAFIADVNQYLPTVSNYKFEVPSYIIGEMDKANVGALDSIHVKIGYTNGLDYPNRSEFYFHAASAGSIAINCHPQFEMPNGYINISVEAEDKTLVVLKDETITVNSNPGLINITIPSGGIYKISIVSKYRSTADLIMYTRGNLFYKKGAFYGDKVESYRYDTTSFPKLIHIPAGIEKLYFSVNNACYNNCLSGEEVSEAFAIRDNQNQLLTVNKSPTDPSLFYINILNPNEGKFWKVSKMREYNLCFSNISNIELFAKARDCRNIDLSAEVISFLGQCHTRITANTEGSHGTLQIKDGSGSYSYTETKIVDLPILLSPNGIIQFISENGCRISKKASTVPGYLHSISACSSSAEPNYTLLQVYPNPSSGIFSFKMNNIQSELIDIRIYGGRGALLAQIKRGNQVDLSSYPSGVYILTGSTGKNLLRFKLVKM